jgi:uncharacterized protein
MNRVPGDTIPVLDKHKDTDMTRDLADWERQWEALLAAEGGDDVSHGLLHIRRVVAAARRLGEDEGAELAVVIPAAWLHDCVNVEKNSPDRARASTLAAVRARELLADMGYPEAHLDPIGHAIEAHSFSAGITPRTLEAQVVQDADRLDALGAIGLARCMMVGERLGLEVYDADDPFCRHRQPDDGQNIIDHFYCKLLRLPDTMQTDAGRAEARRRADFLKSFLDQLGSELPH